MFSFVKYWSTVFPSGWATFCFHEWGKSWPPHNPTCVWCVSASRVTAVCSVQFAPSWHAAEDPLTHALATSGGFSWLGTSCVHQAVCLQSVPATAHSFQSFSSTVYYFIIPITLVFTVCALLHGGQRTACRTQLPPSAVQAQDSRRVHVVFTHSPHD